MLKLDSIRRGNPAHPPLIFLHGFLGSKEDWEEWMPLFEEEWYCVAYDLMLTENIIESVRDEIVASYTRPPHCIGYSMGGRIALHLQDILSAMACLSTHPGLHSDEEKLKRLQTDLHWKEKLETYDSDLLLKEWYAQNIFQSLEQKPQLYEKIVSRRKSQDLKIAAQILMQLSLAKQQEFKEFSIPTAFLYGKEDCKYENVYANIDKNIPVYAIPHAGHTVHLENAEGCVKQIKEFFYGNNT